ncbi:hypothetical protein AXG53_17195 [Stenotrophomonas sp. KCTC 12332]|nr:hypothetical protein AXG53_17195 [Stenotrophomonas sp. KCTC 12332]
MAMMRAMQESLVGEVGLVIMGVAARRRKSVSGQQAALGREVALICSAFAAAPSLWPSQGEGWGGVAFGFGW